ncbi:MAG: DUF2723 domain-containing protein, partial [Nitrospinaceae bacterium]
MGAAWTVYLGTLCPTVFYRDSPEFINTAFALGISHPAGFPTYNLLAKALTFLPLGSVAFRVNLFSALAAVAALALVYAAAWMGLRLFSGDGEDRQKTWAAALATGCLAFSGPFWEQSRLAEVYTLHTAFTAGILLLLLSWRVKEDVRFLYAAALTYGLSAGNHATVAFYLPAILVLFFCWSRGPHRWRDLTRCVLMFLAGLSVFLYLPVRSMAEPSFDFGNPETVEGFIYQVTDRKDEKYHFSVLRDSGVSSLAKSSSSSPSIVERSGRELFRLVNDTWEIGKSAVLDLTRHLSPLSALGILAGGILCWGRSRPLFLFFLIVAGVNVI